MPEATHPANMLRLGVFDLDAPAAELPKQCLKIRAQEKPLQVLTLLLRHVGDALKKEESRQQLWGGGNFVDPDHGISIAILGRPEPVSSSSI